MDYGKRLATGLAGLLAVTSLAACSGGSSGNATAAVTKTFGVVPSGTLPAITYNSASDSFSVAGSSTANLTRSSTSDLTGFHAYTNGTDYIWVNSTSRDATVLFGSVDNGTGKVAGVRYARLADGTVPTSGTASYTGSYGAVLVNSAGKTQQVISGDAALKANFDAGTVDGAITNRQYYNDPNATSTPSGTLKPLTLSGAKLDGSGNFTGGNATGGESNSGADATSNGSYEGVIGGTNGSQIAGGVVITHDNLQGQPTSVTTETGAFIGDK